MNDNYLLSFLQGANNSAASTVSAPVDGIAWALRKAGLNIPSNPIGGSDWMAQQDLTVEPKNKIAGLLGESFGGVAPMLAAAKAPQIAKGLLQSIENLAAPRVLNPQAGVVLGDLNRAGRYTGKPSVNAPSSFDNYNNITSMQDDMARYLEKPTLSQRTSLSINDSMFEAKSFNEMKKAYEEIYGSFAKNESIEKIISAIRPFVFKATQEAKNSAIPFSKAFSNSGKYIGVGEP